MPADIYPASIKPRFDFCVLIPCYNNFDGLVRSINSIVYSTHRFCVVIVDDGSQMPVTAAAIHQYCDPKIEIYTLRLPSNSGITHALNIGLEWISAHIAVNYIARLDCGDICLKDRFILQIKLLQANPSIGLVGSWCTFQSKDKSVSYLYTTPTYHSEISRAMHYRNVFIHPTVMFRANLLKVTGYYPQNYDYVEDYALFWDMLKNSDTQIISKPLVICEINPAGISMSNRRGQLLGRIRVVSQYGTRWSHKMLGTLKLWMLMLLPYKFLIKLKANLK
ncbi:glycosyltransferase [Pontibacter oryzae]|nr:glycosyltransferase [Pontibacter oryzae]